MRKGLERMGNKQTQTEGGRRTIHEDTIHLMQRAQICSKDFSHIQTQTQTHSDTLRHQHSRLFYHSKFSILKFPSSTEQIQCLLLVSVNKYHSRLVVDIVDNIQHQSVLIQMNGKVF